MPRIMSAIVGRINKRDVQPVSYNDRLIITDYSDSENEAYGGAPYGGPPYGSHPYDGGAACSHDGY
ncbi:MAG: hypothetical protein FWH47_06320, partial [Methanomassiliicoccaceae archaeon]|nr:hypothetical protein [Methanomassiliicoccaceae archaeon]